MGARIAEIDFSNLSPGAILQAARAGVVERLCFHRMINSYKSRGASREFRSHQLRNGFAFGNLRRLDGMAINPVLTFVAMARLCDVDWSALCKPSCFPYEYDDGIAIILKEAGPLIRVLSDGPEEGQDSGEEICPIYRNEYESRGVSKPLAKAAWLQCIDSGEGYYELTSPEAPDTMLNTRRSPAQSVDVVKVNANFARKVEESHMDAVPEDVDDLDLEVAVGLDKVERVGVKRRFKDLQVSCCTKRRKVPNTVAEVVELADELVKQVGESGAQVANDVAPVTLPVAKTEVCRSRLT